VTDENEVYAKRAVEELGLQQATDELFPLIYDELRRLAHNWFAKQRGDATLQPTAVVHEAYIRLATSEGKGWETGQHFRAIAARAMRQILVDRARQRRSAKRGGDRWRVTLSGIADDSDPGQTADLVDLDTALAELSGLNKRHATIVELKFFGGLSIPEMAELLGVSERTVTLDWQMARAWLLSRLNGETKQQ
jgi:RNA polymerase sigma factor (TIGR02999 family)